ncbi:inactive beta-amylase 4, chloroplastic isoform X1 [Cynara cardunculus var. scolymus]|uniref:inactive beta-amylase 4, chloroplastic isoform X1 n=1 Tax=Cynara cardunculus var. scolymus TaxID=59895 RepID=UPI000D6244F0|nr:inactive beta-amylase 4, chloroplastic isoform X1 [Cynara cardunculus var. scolymus]
MIDGSIGMACKCSVERRSVMYSNNLREFCFDRERKKFNRKNLRNVSTIPIFKRSFSRCRSVSGKSCIISMDVREKSRSTLFETSKHKRVPIYVMMPIDSFGVDTSGTPRIRKIKALTISLKALKLAGVHGIAVEVWWGIVERFFPHAYNWSLYEELFNLVSEMGLKLQVALSFHSNVHLSSRVQGVSLPQWITEIGRHNKDIYYQDQNGFPNADYLTLGVDNIPLFHGRTAIQCYEDFICSFANKFDSLMGTVIEEVCVGLGPSGELRYPAHPFQDGRWQFPGIGAFQCYDKYMMEDLRAVAWQEGKPDWANKGPPDAGDYNSFPTDVPFFEEGEGSFLSDHGHFFLEWYSDRLLRHADSILGVAAKLLQKYQENEQNSIRIVAKIGLLYWWYQTVSHPAELTAGYYNTAFRDGYDPLTSMLSRHGAALQISCFEMLDNETPKSFLCSPEGLLQQIRTASKKRVVELIGRNTHERFDEAGLKQIHSNCYDSQAEAVRSFTYFRMNDKIFRVENWNNFVPFVRRMSTHL